MYNVDEEGATPQRRRLTRAEAKARTREQLLDAAARAFAQKGFAAASVEEIAELAGYSTGALYSNFDGKEQLFLELLTARRSRGIARQAAAVTEILEEEAAGNEDPFAALSQLLVKVADRNAEFAALQAEFWLYAVRNPEAMGIVAAKLDEQVDALEPLTTLAVERFGAAQGVSPRAVTRVILGLFQGLVRQRRIDPAAVPAELLTQALRWLFAGLQSATTTAGPQAQGGHTAAPKTPDDG
jgi:AcrR family transcriptional regulator